MAAGKSDGHTIAVGVLMRWLAAMLSILVGVWLLLQSYRAYATWQGYMLLDDQSAAEIYQIEFWPSAILGMLLLVLAGFLLGRASRPRS